MATPLKQFFSAELVARIGASIERVHPAFPTRAFVAQARRGLDRKELVDRARHIAAALHACLPTRYGDAVDVLVRSLGPVHSTDELLGVGMAPFFYMPHTSFVATWGLDDFEASMRAQHALTQRFTCEFSIRPFLERHREATLATLADWTRDESPHVRRLVSEGTRPFLPWGSRVKWLENEPKVLVPLLERLKDDPSSMVRRSVANHLNDHARRHADWVCDVAQRWLDGASRERTELIEHALRGCVKAGSPRALALLGFGGKAQIEVRDVRFSPSRVAIGGVTRVEFTLASKSRRRQSLALDLVVHFVKAAGTTSPKVFKVARTELAAGEARAWSKTISLAQHTTRTPRPGRHAVELVVNGTRRELGAFAVARARAPGQGAVGRRGNSTRQDR